MVQLEKSFWDNHAYIIRFEIRMIHVIKISNVIKKEI